MSMSEHSTIDSYLNSVPPNRLKELLDEAESFRQDGVLSEDSPLRRIAHFYHCKDGALELTFTACEVYRAIAVQSVYGGKDD